MNFYVITLNGKTHPDRRQSNRAALPACQAHGVTRIYGLGNVTPICF